jgi:putative transposase
MPAIFFVAREYVAGMARSYNLNRIFMKTDFHPGYQALRRGRLSLAKHIYHITTTTKNRQRFFENFHASRIAARCLDDPALLKNSQILAWVLMPDHMHCLIQLGDEDKLDIFVNRLKSAMARHVNRYLCRGDALWSAGFYDHAMRNDESLIQTAEYIVNNPLRAELVSEIGDYPFWNHIWL